MSYEATEKLRKRFNLGTEIRATTPKKRKSSLELDTLFSQLELDQYELISDWENYAILSLASLSHFEMSPENISRHLNISLERATHSFQLLIRLGFLKKSRNGKWIQATAPLKVDNSISTKATREAQKKIIHKSLESLENDPIEERDFNAVMMAIDESLVPLAKEKIKDFRRKLMLELEGLGGANRAYIFSMQFFPVSKKHEAYSK